jgi:hypothetical protein
LQITSFPPEVLFVAFFFPTISGIVLAGGTVRGSEYETEIRFLSFRARVFEMVRWEKIPEVDDAVKENATT